MKLSEELQWRGFWNQTTFTDDKLIDSENFTLYLGTDPSADSLHVGHLAVYMMVRHFLERGHKVFLLVGGGTGMIGDMRDTEERNLLSYEEIEHNKQALKSQVSRIFAGRDFTLVDNADWLAELELLPFLRDIGKNFNMADLVSREFFKARINNGKGLSFAEFTYTLLQGYDFWHLFNQYGVNLQIGGSDQWGNLLSGVDLIRKKENTEVYAMTAPLLINKSTGRKFGKSEGNAVWLDATKTTPYEMYQFWLNVMDDDAVRFLKIFTFLSLEEIEEIGKEFDQARHQRLAQKVLAREVVTLVHGKEAYEQAVHITEQLFAGNLKALSARDLKVALNGVPTYEISADENLNIVELLVNAKISPSKRQAREDVQNGAIYINGERVQDLDYTLSDADKIDNEITVIRRGKKKNFVLTY